MSNGTKSALMKSIASIGSGNSILVHGGGPAVSSLCERLGIEPKFITSPSGIRSRYTDSETMEAFVMAMKGKINTEIVLELQKIGMKAAGISGIDGPTILAERKKRLLTVNERGRKMMVDGGYTGKIVKVDPTLINSFIERRITPVISPIALSSELEPLNVDGDRAAASIAGAVKAEDLVLLTNVDGVMLEGELVPQISRGELPDFMKRVGHGMDKKLLAAGEALNGGCKKVIIVNGNSSESVNSLIEAQKGTVITS